MCETDTVALLISLGSSVAAAVAAVAAWRAVHATRKGTEAQIIIQLRNEFSSNDIHEALKVLRSFKDEHGGQFSRRFIELESSNLDRFQKLNDARRKINGYHKKVYLLNKNKLIEDNLISSLISRNQFKFIMEVLEPYERMYASNNQNVTIDEAFFHWVSKHSV